MTAINWPESVPVLTAEDIHQGGYLGPKRSKCLVGWCREVSGFYSGAPKDWRLHDVLVAEISEDIGADNVAHFNDTNPKATVAEAWNTTMRRLGYTEVDS